MLLFPIAGSALGAALAAKQKELGRTCLFVGDGSL
jgi:TPP-dependent 2-oxoacid decarboxylase